jgi:heme-degrading monooxygenase HmoA
MAVKVIIKRKVPKGKEGDLSSLLLKLRALATAQAGYISGETLINVDNPEDYLVISTWRSVNDWKAWAESKERAALQGKIDSLLSQKTEYGIYFYR